MASDARERMIQSAALLFRERGLKATAFSDVLEHSGAPRGSIYHHFPGGKAQLAAEATHYAGDFTAAAIAAATSQGDFAAAIGSFVEFYRQVLLDSDCAAGCPVQAAALEGQEAPAAQAEAGAAFRRWHEVCTQALEQHGVPTDRARGFSLLAIAGIQGALVLARAQRSVAPLDDVGAELQALARRELDDAGR